MLTTRTAKREHQRREATLYISTHVSISQLIHGIEEGQNFSVVLQETDDGLVESCQLLIGLITAWVMRRTTIEDVATAIAGLVLRNTFSIRETEDTHHQRTLCVVFRERGRAVLRMGLIGIVIRCLVAISTRRHRLNLLVLRQFRQTTEHINQVRIGERTLTEQLAQILHGRRNALDEVLLALEIASEAVSPQYLQLTEEYKQCQTLHKTMGCGHLRILLQGIVVFKHQFSAQLVRILRTGLPQERCQIIVVRSPTASLEVDKKWLLAVSC